MIDVDFDVVAEELLSRIRSTFKWAGVPEEKGDYQRLVDQWARSLRMANKIWPKTIYYEALDLIICEASAKDNPPMPGDVIRAAHRVIERIESDPRRRPALEKYREEYRRARVAMLTGES